jgi:hypothetical protein
MQCRAAAPNNDRHAVFYGYLLAPLSVSLSLDDMILMVMQQHAPLIEQLQKNTQVNKFKERQPA